MAYRFEADESVRGAITRTAREQLERAAHELADGGGTDPARAVHTARKAIKKERSLLRLARGTMPRQQRRRADTELRDAARGLSGARDADVMITSISRLSDRFAGQLPEAAFQRLRAHLEARRPLHHQRGNGSAIDERTAQDLLAARTAVDGWQLGRGGWKALESGLLRSYGRGRHAFARARASRETDDLHAWRKRVKDLWYHERLLGPACGPAVRGHAKDLDRLADVLGDDHDLAVLRQELAERSAPVAVDVEAVIGLIDHRRTELQAEAMRIGERVYAEKVKAFEGRMRRSWKAGRALARAPRAQRPAELAAATR